MSNIPLPALSIQPPRQPDLLGQVAKMRQIQAMGQEQQLRGQQIQTGDLENQMRQRDMLDQQTTMQILGKHNGDLESALPELASHVSAKTFLGLQKSAVELKKTTAELDNKTLENKKLQSDQFLGLIGTVSQMDPATYQQNWPQIAARALEVEPELKGHVDPSQPIPQQMLQQYGMLFQTQSTALAKEAAQRAQKAQEETARHNQATEKQQAAGLENNVSEAKLAFRAAQGDPDAIKAMKLLQQQKLASRPPRNDQAAADAIEAAAQSIATMNPKDLTRLKDVASLRGDQRLLIYNRAKQINPNFSTAEVDRKAKMLDSFTNGKDGQQLQSFGTFLEHAGEASRVTNEFRTTSIPLVNTPLNAIRSKFGDESYSRFIAALEPVRKEFEGFLLGGRALYGDDRKAAETILSDSSSPAQIQGALKQMGHTVKARQNEIGHRFKNTMGATMEDVLGPMSQEALEGSRLIGLDMGQSGGKSSAQQGDPLGIR
jgi:hypothetical protein